MNSGESSYRRYLAGDKSGFDEIIELYHDGLISFLKRYVISEQDAEDIAADTFLEMLIHPSRYSFKSSLKTYIFSVARHKAIDYARKHRRELFPEEWDEAVFSESNDGPDAHIEQSEKQKEISNAMSKINSEYREILYLIYFEGLSGDDVSRVMNKNKKQTANLLYRAKAALKNELMKGGYSYDE